MTSRLFGWRPNSSPSVTLLCLQQSNFIQFSCDGTTASRPTHGNKIPFVVFNITEKSNSFDLTPPCVPAYVVCLQQLFFFICILRHSRFNLGCSPRSTVFFLFLSSDLQNKTWHTNTHTSFRRSQAVEILTTDDIGGMRFTSFPLITAPVRLSEG